MFIKASNNRCISPYLNLKYKNYSTKTTHLYSAYLLILQKRNGTQII